MFLPRSGILTDVEQKEPLRASEPAARTSLPPSFLNLRQGHPSRLLLREA